MPGAVYIMRNAAGAHVAEAVLLGEVFYFYYGGHGWRKLKVES
jgi:hypothetical protein